MKNEADVERRRDLVRYIRIVGFLVLLVYAALQTGSVQQQSGEISDLSGALSRRSPLADYQQAEALHDNCRSNYEDAYLAAVGVAITAKSSADPQLAAARMEIARLTKILANIEVNCPTPTPPVFTDDGSLVSPAVLPPSTTSTTSSFNVPPPAG